MKKQIMILICCLFAVGSLAEKRSTVYIDDRGVMRWSDTHREASFFGVNYTLPFAHAYRAIGYLGLDRKAAIEKDVYHFSRLGYNAYRIHVWDVELSDSIGNLIDNEHLELLDYLISKLQERNIRVIITAQTNFGNGYPEPSEPTGGFSYLYPKCDVHLNPKAIAAQERYIVGLVKHVNRYTGQAYLDDPSIIGFEVNNEPCHAGTQAETKAYINSMLAALKRAGNEKPIFYNVSHNLQQTEAYYDTAIQGTTYQWYPTGLVAGFTRKGNFLPHVDNYHIPFDKVRGFEKKARLVYEFDPADIMYSYMYPAVARTFRKAGFQWITQFAYDPMDMAWANTEYQTHFLNLAYTPGKAISTKIAAEVVADVKRGESFGTYPADTLFKHFRVSYSQDLSELNSPEKYFYSNYTSTKPVAPQQLEAIAGYGCSPVVGYEGCGAYFIDKLEGGVWRLEVMPDAITVNDPFSKPSLGREVVTIIRSAWDMTLRLPDLGESFSIKGIDKGNQYHAETVNGTMKALHPGVYLLQKRGELPTQQWDGETHWRNIRLGEYAAPNTLVIDTQVIHQPTTIVSAGSPFSIEAQVVGTQLPDSVLVYTDQSLLWNNRTRPLKMERTRGYIYRAVIPETQITEGRLKYYITVYQGNKQQTFPVGKSGNPLHWDYERGECFETKVVAPGSTLHLLTIQDEQNGIEAYSMPAQSSIVRKLISNVPTESTLRFVFQAEAAPAQFFLRKYIKDEIGNRSPKLATCTHLCLHLKKQSEQLNVGFITSDGYTYTAACPPTSGDVVRIPLLEMKQTPTAILPHPYPGFLEKYFEPITKLPFCLEKIESLELSLMKPTDETVTVEVGSIWLE